jgi:hypothetical protein
MRKEGTIRVKKYIQFFLSDGWYLCLELGDSKVNFHCRFAVSWRKKMTKTRVITQATDSTSQEVNSYE